MSNPTPDQLADSDELPVSIYDALDDSGPIRNRQHPRPCPPAVAAKIVKVMADIGDVQKLGFNQHFNYAYARDVEVAKAVRAALIKHKLVMLPNIVGVREEHGTDNKGRHQVVVTVDVDYQIVDAESGEQWLYRALGQGSDALDKGYYKALTGASKYALIRLFHIPVEDYDPDADAGKESGNRVANPEQTITKDQAKDLTAKLKEAGISVKAFNNRYNLSALTQLPAEQLAEAMTAVESAAQKAGSANE